LLVDEETFDEYALQDWTSLFQKISLEKPMNPTEVEFSVALISGDSSKKSIQRAVVRFNISNQKSYLNFPKENVEFYQIDKTNLQTVRNFKF
jgi:hypothetical protein